MTLSVGAFLIGIVILVSYYAKSRGIRMKETSKRFMGLAVVVAAVAAVVLYSIYNGFGIPIWSSEDYIQGFSGVTPPTHRVGVDPDLFYGIMFDAGSTGSRIHAFKFKHKAPGEPFEFVDELFEQVKPGLSSYADDPKQAADSLIPLIEKAKQYIPQSMWASTPVALKATAGLRLLPGTKSDAILKRVRHVLKKTPFISHSDDSVKILDGDDEGVFSWFTVNFLTGGISRPEKLMGVMDLGGGSTQITFVPKDPATLADTPQDYINTIKILGKKFQLYTHSYLGLGLMSGRLQVLGGHEGAKSESALSSPCFPEEFASTWQHGGHTYDIKGTSPMSLRFDPCYKKAVQLVKSAVHKPAEIANRTFCTISYYYDRAVDTGLIGKGKGEKATIEQYFEAAQSACTENYNSKEPFLCLDMAYICALLHDGFGFPKHTSVRLIKQIEGREISWALGAMFKLLDSLPPSSDTSTAGR